MTTTIEQPQTTTPTARKLTRPAMRLLADELGVSTMAAYRHLDGGKDDIVTTLVSGLLEDGVPLDAGAGRLHGAGVDVDEVTARTTTTWTVLEQVPGLRLVLAHDQEHVRAWAERATEPVHWMRADQIAALRDGLITALIGSPTIETVHVTASALVDYQSGPRGGTGAH